MTTCEVCDTTTGDDTYLCRDHGDTLADAVHKLPTLANELLTTYAREDNMRGPGRTVGKSTETPLVWNDSVSPILDTLTDRTTVWARSAAISAGVRTFPGIYPTRDPHDPARIPDRVTEFTVAARLLATHVKAIGNSPGARHAYDDITGLVRRAERAIDRPAERKFLGICSAALGQGMKCEADIYALPWKKTVQCPACNAEYDVAERREVMVAAMRDHLEWESGTVPEVAGWLRMSGVAVGTSTVRRWAAQKRMPVSGHNRRGHPMYRFGAVREVFERLHKQTAKAS